MSSSSMHDYKSIPSGALPAEENANWLENIAPSVQFVKATAATAADSSDDENVDQGYFPLAGDEAKVETAAASNTSTGILVSAKDSPSLNALRSLVIQSSSFDSVDQKQRDVTFFPLFMAAIKEGATLSQLRNVIGNIDTDDYLKKMQLDHSNLDQPEVVRIITESAHATGLTLIQTKTLETKRLIDAYAGIPFERARQLAFKMFDAKIHATFNNAHAHLMKTHLEHADTILSKTQQQLLEKDKELKDLKASQKEPLDATSIASTAAIIKAQQVSITKGSNHDLKALAAHYKAQFDVVGTDVTAVTTKAQQALLHEKSLIGEKILSNLEILRANSAPNLGKLLKRVPFSTALRFSQSMPPATPSANGIPPTVVANASNDAVLAASTTTVAEPAPTKFALLF